MKTITSLSVATLLAYATSTTAQQGQTGFNFQITASSVSPTYQPSFSGNLLTGFRAGATEDEIVTTANPDYAASFTIQNNALVLNSFYPFVVHLSDTEPYLSDAPSGYNIISAAAGDPSQDGTKPFSYDATTSEVSLSQPDITFVLCNVNATSPHPDAGPQTQLLWRRLSQSSPDTRSPPRCADVILQAVQVLKY